MFRRSFSRLSHTSVPARRYVSNSAATMAPLRLGFIPEHFSTPLHFAKQHYDLNANLVPEPLGTGALTARLKAPSSDSNSIDVAVGLTEAFVADLGKARLAGEETGYGIVGTYVQSPLCWAIITGANRDGFKSVADLKSTRVGVSRVGSGSYVMSYVLADQHGWLEPGSGKDPFDVVVAGDFAALRKAVREEGEKKADFFMWEHFTTRKFWENGEVRRIGEIYTPWPSWLIVARHGVGQDVPELLEKINEGVKRFGERPDEAVKSITDTMHYSEKDAREWMEGVRFSPDVRGVDMEMVEKTVGVLRKAGVLKGDVENAGDMISYRP